MGLDIWFTSGQNFLSKNELDTKEDIKLWNSRIKQNDLVYCLGDFSCQPFYVEYCHNLREIFKQLNGKKFLIPSPNDSPITKYDLNWVTTGGLSQIEFDDQKFCLSYFPFDCWQNQSKGSINLFGSDYESQRKHNRMSVNQKYYYGLPLKLEQIVEQINNSNFVY